MSKNKNGSPSKLTDSKSRLSLENIKSNELISCNGQVPLHKEADDIIVIPVGNKTAESSLSAITEAECGDPLVSHKSQNSCQSEQIFNVKSLSATYENGQNGCQQHSSLQNLGHKTETSDGLQQEDKIDYDFSSTKHDKDCIDVTTVSLNQHPSLDKGGINPSQVKMSKKSDENISVDKQGEIQDTSSLRNCIPSKGIGDGMNCMFLPGTQSSTNTTSCDQHEGDGTTTTRPNCTNNIQARSTVFGICTVYLYLLNCQ